MVAVLLMPIWFSCLVIVLFTALTRFELFSTRYAMARWMRFRWGR